ncbi:hypothetical protein GCM10009642_27410 [Nocardiopsis metallicus]
MRVAARPLGNEPSPYSGFSVPDGRSLSLRLDGGLGYLTEVVVTSPGSGALDPHARSDHSGGVAQ